VTAHLPGADVVVEVGAEVLGRLGAGFYGGVARKP
jgi:hypothetical protein